MKQVSFGFFGVYTFFVAFIFILLLLLGHSFNDVGYASTNYSGNESFSASKNSSTYSQRPLKTPKKTTNVLNGDEPTENTFPSKNGICKLYF